jgi:hypothetical protein
MNEDRDMQPYEPPSPVVSFGKFVATVAGALLLLGVIVYLATNWKVVVAYSWVALLIVGVLVALLIAIGGLYIREDLQDRRERRGQREERHELEIHLARTRLPADERGNRSFIYDEHSSQVIEVSSGNYIANVPHTFSPRMEWHPTSQIALPESPAAEEAASAIDLIVPTFAELFESRLIGAGLPLMIGYDYDSGQPHQGSWLDLYSCAVAGLQGSGKTTTELWIILQSVLHVARLLVIDPHRDATQDSLGGRLAPLASCFLHPVAGDDAREILAVVKLARREVERRRRGLTGAPTILVVDEFTKMMRRSPEIKSELSACIEEIAQEGRKLGVFALLSGQLWKATAVGGTELRYSLASAFVHRIQEAQSRLLLVDQQYAKFTGTLKRGQAYFSDTNGDTHLVQIPLTTAQDVVTVARALTAPTSADFAATSLLTSQRLQYPAGEVEPPPMEKLVPKAHEAEAGQEPSARLLPPELERKYAEVVALMAQEKKQGDIIAAVWGVTSGGGAAYQKSAEELRRIQRVMAQRAQSAQAREREAF